MDEENTHYMMEKIIVKILQKFVNDNPNIVCRYEYNEVMGCYLISYILPKDISGDDVIWEKLALLKTSIETNIPNNPPLFTRDDIVFTLSSSAVTVRNQSQLDPDEQTFSLLQNEEYYFEECDDDQVFYGSYRVYSKAA